MNPVMQNMYDRTSIRKYESTPLSRDVIDELLKAAVQAPCGGNTQFWKFLVLESDEAKYRLNLAVRDGMRDLVLGENPYKSKVNGKRAAQNDDYCCFFHAPAWIVIANQKTHPNAMADCSLAVSNLMHAATSMGLGTCWVNQVPWTQDDPRVAEVLRDFGLPEDYVVCVSVAVGIPAHAPKKPERKAPDALYL